MINRTLKQVSVILFFALLMVTSACSQGSDSPAKNGKANLTVADSKDTAQKYKVTFIELGSVRCIPCQQMQPVMKSIEAKYGKEVKVDFHDVWTDAGKPFAAKYGIEAIPTQVFLDETGKEFFRHVGYFSEEELVKVLQQKGIKPI